MSVFSEGCWASSCGHEWLGWPSDRGISSVWGGHVPFAHWLVSALQPATIVELGTMRGVSYAAFCETVKRVGLPTKCWSVDHWQGDDHAGHYDNDLYESMLLFNSERYHEFSTLIKKSFDDAVFYFKDGSIDLLHIDGYHTYESVRHDFESKAFI